MATAKAGNEPDYSVALAGKKEGIPFFVPDVRPKISPEIRDLLVNHYKIPPDDVDDHCQRIRDKAWNLRAYPCIGIGGFLQRPLVRSHPQYSQFVQSLTPESLILDIGCFIGLELRLLCLDLGRRGFQDPASQVRGLDCVNFWDLGLEFFRDGSTFGAPGRFGQADFLGDLSTIDSFKHAFDAVTIKEVLHQFNLAEMTDACERLMWFVKLKPGSQIIGNQIGFIDAGLKSFGKSGGHWFHNGESFKETWKEIERRTKTRWNVQVALKTFEELGWEKDTGLYMGEDRRMLFFHCELGEVEGA